MSAKSLTIIRGLPGSGKSTLAMSIAIATKACVAEADDWMVDEAGNYAFDGSKLKWCHEQCLRQTRDLLQAGYNVVVANTFTTFKEAAPYIELAVGNGVQLNILTCTGEYGSIHNVPQATMEKMRARWEEF